MPKLAKALTPADSGIDSAVATTRQLTGRTYLIVTPLAWNELAAYAPSVRWMLSGKKGVAFEDARYAGPVIELDAPIGRKKSTTAVTP